MRWIDGNSNPVDAIGQTNTVSYSAHRSSAGTWCILFPWVFGLQDDLSTLEVAEAGIFEQLSDAHIGLTGQPNGWTAYVELSLFQFAAEVEIESLGLSRML